MDSFPCTCCIISLDKPHNIISAAIGHVGGTQLGDPGGSVVPGVLTQAGGQRHPEEGRNFLPTDVSREIEGEKTNDYTKQNKLVYVCMNTYYIYLCIYLFFLVICLFIYSFNAYTHTHMQVRLVVDVATYSPSPNNAESTALQMCKCV